MLVLSRNVEEVIVIENDIKITILEVRRKRVKVGIDAPKGISIDRKEVYDRKHEDDNSNTNRN